jgi:hypothetical protein
MTCRRVCVIAAIALTSLTSVPSQAQPAPDAEPAPAPDPETTPEPEVAPVLEPVPAPTPPDAPAAPAPAQPPPAEPPPPEAAPAAPAAPPPLVVTGSFFGRYELRAGYDQLGVSRAPRFLESDATFYRARLGLATSPIAVADGTTVALQFTPQSTGVLGVLPNTVTDAALNLHEGYARVASSAFRLDFGRFEMNYGDSLVIGSLDWNETARSFDGIRTRIAPDPQGYYVDVFFTLLDEGRPELFEPVGAGDHYFAGVYAGVGPEIAKGLDLDLYGLAQIWPSTDGIRVAPMDPMNTATVSREAAAEFTLGARAKQRIGSFDYRVETGVQAGSRLGALPAMPAMPPADIDSMSVLAYHADAELGVTVLDDKFRVGLEGLIASGDDPGTSDKFEGWNELYPTAHKFLGLSDIFVQAGIKRTNVASGVLHLTAKPTADLTVQVDGHVFSRLEPMTATGDSGYAGAEIDAGAVYALAKNLTLRALYALFVPDQDFYPAGAVAESADPAHYLEVELRYDLK